MASADKKLFIKTWGCQMNAYDSHRMADILRPLGYRSVESPEDADMIVLNTCHIREKATDKLFSELGRLREHKNDKTSRGQRMILAVAGCVAQAEGEVILDRAPYVDMVFGPQTYHQLPEMVARSTGAVGPARIVVTDFAVEEKFDLLPADQLSQGPCAFVSVQEGCDKFCTFCVVPYTRGGEFSRPAQAIVDEIRRLVDGGARDITLLGQNVNAWHGSAPDSGTWNLARLIEEISRIESLDRIRYTTSHPRDMDDDLIAAHGHIEKLMPFLHLPVQSGSDRILEKMNRKHGRDLYFDIIKKLRKIRPDIALSSDFIVGFPGETEEDFEQTLDLIQEIGFSSAYSFMYSPRPGTPAANMAPLVPDAVKAARLERLQTLISAQSIDFNKKFIKKSVPVLFDRTGRRPGQIHGRTPWNQAIHVCAPESLCGRIGQVRVTDAFAMSLEGEILRDLDADRELKRA